MKKIVFLLLSLLSISSILKADNDRPITFTQLPQQSQQFVNTHFGDISIALVKKETDFFDQSYEIFLTNGDKIEFDKKGVWKEIDCKYTEVPTTIIPVAIKNYIIKNYPGQKIHKIEKQDRGGWEVDLSEGLELTFNPQFELTEIDN